MSMPKQKPGRSKQNYRTPKTFLKAVATLLGIGWFSHDFAADRHNTVVGLSYWTEKDNSLTKSIDKWAEACDYEWGWLNPPYADIAPWAIKSLLSMRKHGAKIAFLVPASVGSNWYRDYIHGQNGVKTLFLNGRLNFIGENWRKIINPSTGKFYTSEPLYPKDCMLVLFGTGEPYSAEPWTWR